jgi:tetratricopeptide (TPR) repeat protein
LNEALDWIQRVIDVEPTSIDAHRFRASLLERQRHFDAALTCARHAFSIDPDNADTIRDITRIEVARAAWLRHTRDTSSAPGVSIAAARELAQDPAAETRDLIELAHRLAAAEQLNEALDWIQRVLAIDPAAIDAYRFRASVLERQGRFDAALVTARRALSLDPNDGSLQREIDRIEGARTNSLRHTRDTASDGGIAIAAARELAQRPSASVHDLSDFAHRLAAAEQLNEALDWIQRVLAIEPDRIDALRFHSSMLERLGRSRQALRIARRARALSPGDRGLREDCRRIRRKALLQSLGIQKRL